MGGKLKTRKGLHAGWAPRSPRYHDGPTYILQIPYDIQVMICKAILAAPPPVKKRNKKKDPRNWTSFPDSFASQNIRDLLHLGQSCRALYGVTAPVVYRQIDFLWQCVDDLPETRRTIWTRAETLRFLRLLRTLANNKALAELVRFADLENLVNAPAFSWPRTSYTRDDPKISALIRQIGVDSKDSPRVQLWEGGFGFKGTTLGNLLVALFLAMCPNLRSARLPFGSHTAMDLKHNEPVARFRSNSGAGQIDTTNTESRPAFPNLEELEIVAWMLSGVVGRPYETLAPRDLAHILKKSPKLHKLRLDGVHKLKANSQWNLGMITSLTLVHCSLDHLDVRKLATACSNLRNFEMTHSFHSPEGWRGRNRSPPVWRGEEGFEDYIPHDTNGGHFTNDGEAQSNEPLSYLPFASEIVNSSLILEALSPASSTLETIILGKCTSFRALPELNRSTRKHPFARFTRLRTLGILHTNLLPLSWEEGNPDPNVLVDIIQQCPHLGELMILGRDDFCAYDSSILRTRPLVESVRRLRQVLDFNSSLSHGLQRLVFRGFHITQGDWNMASDNSEWNGGSLAELHALISPVIACTSVGDQEPPCTDKERGNTPLIETPDDSLRTFVQSGIQVVDIKERCGLGRYCQAARHTYPRPEPGGGWTWA